MTKQQPDYNQDIKNSDVFDKETIFHYTNFESAVKILSSKKLRFGEFMNMNDIAENSKQYLSNVSEVLIENELRKYRSISFAKDKKNNYGRGFSIDSLWGYYGERGNGICLAFDKKELIKNLKEQYQYTENGEIKYIPCNTINFIFQQNEKNYIKFIKKQCKSLFFYKDTAWKHEQEFRVLVYSDAHSIIELSIENSLVGAILCLPNVTNINNTPEYKSISAIAQDIPIMRYRRSLGNKELEDSNGNVLWPILGRDYYLDLDE